MYFSLLIITLITRNYFFIIPVFFILLAVISDSHAHSSYSLGDKESAYENETNPINSMNVIEIPKKHCFPNILLN